MSKILYVFLLITMIQTVSFKAEDDGAGTTTELKRVPLGDPFIMLWDGTYYAYGTYATDGIAVYVSDDLEHWSIPAGAADGLALHKNDVWADRWFWAPEVYAIDGKFYMYYSADEHICVAVADSPLGPFVQDAQEPMITDEKAIDNALFRDDDGKKYLLFDRFNDGNAVWIAEMEDDLIHLKAETMTPCLHVSQAWEEVWPRVNEGAFMYKHNGIYYLTYSANSYESQFYGVGFATATSPYGPWTKYDNNPILQKPGNLVGVGHSALFTDKDGKLRIVFHAHKSQNEIHPRHMYIGTVGFKTVGNAKVMYVEDEILTPYLTATK